MSDEEKDLNGDQAPDNSEEAQTADGESQGEDSGESQDQE